MLVIELKCLSSGAARLGATRAQEDFGPVRDELSGYAGEKPRIVVFNFFGIEHTNTSYVRNSIYWLNVCGRRFASGDGAAGDGPWDPRPIPAIPVVQNLAPEVREAIDEVFCVRGASCLEATDIVDGRLVSARLLGALEPKLFAALRQVSLLDVAYVTAADLHARFSATEDIGVTAWNNRLSELYHHLLFTRTRHGKYWHYQSITKGVEDGRGSRT